MRVVATVLAALFLLPATALGADRYTDARGDVAGGPDITAVTLSHTDAAVTIAVEFAGAPPLRSDAGGRYTDMLLVGIHTDDDVGRLDVEFYTGVHGVDLAQAPVVRAGAGSRRAQIGEAEVEVDGARLALTIPRSLLGDPDEIAVAAAAGRELADESGGAGGRGDEAPATGAFRHSLADGGRAGWSLAVLVGGVALAALLASLAVARRRGRGDSPGDYGFVTGCARRSRRRRRARPRAGDRA